MRFALAIAALVAAGILLVLGIGQRTFLAGPSEIVYGIEAGAGAEYAVLPAAELDAVPGQANVVLAGEGSFAAVGSTIDVEAWVAPFAHDRLVADSGGLRIVTGESIAPVAPDDAEGDGASEEAPADDAADDAEAENAEDAEAVDPAGSDLWLGERDGSGRLPLALDDDESVLIRVVDGGEASIAWVQDRSTPWAGPLLAAGGALALLGGVLYLIAVDHDRRGLGPRRGRRGPLQGIRSMFGRGGRNGRGAAPAAPSEAAGTKRKRIALPALPVLGLAVALGLSGCSADYWPDFSAEPADTETTDEPAASNVAPAPVTQAQIDRIVDDVVSIAGQADEALDSAALEPRFTGDALKQRAANYKIRKKVSDYEVILPRITDEQLGYELVQSTEGWPRTVFITLASETPGSDEDAEKKDEKPADADADTPAEDAEAQEPPASPSLALVMTQEDPHQNYRVSQLFSLRGGIAMPEAAPAEEGTALLADDLQSLVLPPGQVGDAYAQVLVGKTDTEEAALFDVEGDTIIEKSGAAWVKAAKKAASDDGYDVKYSVAAEQSDAQIMSLSTGVGGALVATTVNEFRTEKQAGSYQPKAVGAVTAISGLKGRQKRIVSQVSHQLLFFVPSGTSGEGIQMLGYTSELVGAKK